MKNRILLALVAAIFLCGGNASAGLGDWFYGESWKFMESVGGVAIGQPSRNPQGVYPYRQDDAVKTSVLTRWSSACCVAAPSAAMRGVCAVPIAAGSIRSSATTISVFV